MLSFATHNNNVFHRGQRLIPSSVKTLNAAYARKVCERGKGLSHSDWRGEGWELLLPRGPANPLLVQLSTSSGGYGCLTSVFRLMSK